MNVFATLKLLMLILMLVGYTIGWAMHKQGAPWWVGILFFTLVWVIVVWLPKEKEES